MKASAHKVTLTLNIYTTVARVSAFQPCFTLVGCHSTLCQFFALPPQPPAIEVCRLFL